jgi:NAD(P)-dependent dehydrogenase (short-subunit alcohol dehydrogenase family)
MNILQPSVKVHAQQFDPGDEAGVKDIVDEAIRLYGRLDVFFANAAMRDFGGIGVACGRICNRSSILVALTALI